MKRAAAAPSSASGVVRTEPGRTAERFETLARISPVGIFECDLTGCCTFINHVWETVQQEPAENALGFGWLERVHPDDRGQFEPGARAFEANTDPVERRFRVLRPSGELRSLRIRLARLHSPQGVHVGWSGTFEDVTEATLEADVARAVLRHYQALAELTLRATDQSEPLLETVARRTLDALTANQVEIVDAESKLLARMAGTEPHEGAPGEVLSATITGPNGVEATITASLPTGRPASLKAVHASFLDSVANLVSICLERGARQRWLRAVFEGSVDAQLQLRADGTIRDANAATARCLGIPAQDLVGRPIETLGLSERARAAWQVTLQQARSSRHGQSFEFVLDTPAGQRLYSAHLEPVARGDDTVEFVAVTLHDVSERIGQAQLADLQRELLDREDRLDALLGNLLGERAVLRERARTWGLAGLTTREQTILRLMATGKTNRQIGAELGMSPGTVRNRISLLLPKLGAADRTQAVAIAIQSGLLGTFNMQGEPAPAEDIPVRPFNLGEFE
jgi:PAS domain S-box-containing protein